MDNQKLKTELNNIKDLEKYIGKEIGITDWFQITQDDINAFAKLTHDEQWIHTDIEKSKKYSYHSYLNLDMIRNKFLNYI